MFLYLFCMKIIKGSSDGMLYLCVKQNLAYDLATT